MLRKMITLALGLTMAAVAQGQEKRDTVIVSMGKTSQVIFTIEDKSDIDILKYYDFQALFNDILRRLEENDTSRVDSTRNEVATNDNEPEEDWRTSDDEDDNHDDNDDFSTNHDDDDDDNEWRERERHRRGRIGRTWQSTNMDLGINNYLTQSDQFPDGVENHSVRPWGSWYVAINSMQRTKAGRNFFIEWGLGVSWYNFKFQNDHVSLVRDDQMVNFTTDLANPEYDYIKSKLRVTYLNASLIPVLDFGDRGRKPRLWDGHGSEFRIGIGPYVGYKIGSKSKIVYNDEDDDRKREKTRDSYYLNDLRYGARLQIGFRSTDFFINYDMNELFKENRGPKLNAVSFGVIF